MTHNINSILVKSPLYFKIEINMKLKLYQVLEATLIKNLQWIQAHSPSIKIYASFYDV